MLNTVEIKERIFDLFAETEDKPVVTGSGIITNRRFGFDQLKIDQSKREFASYLKEIGINEKPLVSLDSFTKTKDGEVWNELKTIEDFQALELLVACSNACGFIRNDVCVKKANINHIGDLNSILISEIGRQIINDDDKYLECIRKNIAGNMYFVSNTELINKLSEEKTYSLK